MNLKNQQNIENGKEMCNHNYKEITNTLIGVPKIKMVTPATYYLKCKICNEVVTINQSEISDIKEFIRTFF